MADRKDSAEDTLADQLKERLAGVKDLDIGQMEFVNLDEVRKITGENWGDWRERIFVATESIIGKHTSKRDIIIRADQGFLVIFAELDEAAAKNEAELIASEVRAFFLGAPEFEHLGLRIETSRVTPQEFAKTLSKAKAYAPSSADAGLEQLTGAVSLLAGRKSRLPPVSIGFLPVWNAVAEAVGMFFCVPVRRMPNGDYKSDHHILGTSPDRRDLYALDLHILRRSIEALDDLLSRGLRSAIAISMHYSVLMKADYRVQILHELANCPDEFKDLLLLRIDDAPKNPSPPSLMEITRICAPYVQQIVLHRLAGEPIPQVQEGAHINAFGLSVVGRRQGGARIHKDVEAFVAKAGAQNRQAYLAECADLQLVRQAARSGAVFFSGPAIGDFLNMPTAPFRLTWADLEKREALRNGTTTTVQVP